MKPVLAILSLLVLFATSPNLAQAQTSGGIVVAPQQCSPEERSQAALEAERATLERVRMDMRAEGRVAARALGVDEHDCLSRAMERAQRSQYQAINECVNQTIYFRNCEIQGHRVLEQPRPLLPIAGNGSIDETKIDEIQCKHQAEQRALRDALINCERSYNSPCRIAAGPTAASYKVERRRRYGLFGPKEDFHICHSRAEALPDTRERFQCAVEIYARVRF